MRALDDWGMPVGTPFFTVASGPQRRPLQARLLCGAAVGVVLAGTALVAPTPAAAAAVVLPAVGSTVINPDTGLPETVAQQVGGNAVLTSDLNFIVVSTTVGDTYVNPADGFTYTVQSVTNNAAGRPVSVVVKDNQSTPVTSTLTVLADKSADFGVVPGGVDGDPGSAGGTITPPPPPAGNLNVYDNQQRGGDGGDGRDGFGVEVCIPVIGCARVAYDPHAGDPGGDGPTIAPPTITGTITTITDGLAGITVASIGGDGGQGGDAYGAIDGEHGGAAGRGGNVTVVSSATVTTSGDAAHGMFVQSRAGIGGAGGSGYILGGGGSGGGAAQGGNVDVTNNGVINTTGDDAIGILAQSLGGAAGGGGNSFGIIGDSGGGSMGGDGGNVVVRQNGEVHTAGAGAHGVLSQSIGGTGGSSGVSGGIVAFGNDGAAGGNGGSASIITGANSITTTTGDSAHALFAESVGGGGGTGGAGGGVVTLGSDGGGGGTGGAASIENSGQVLTTGTDSRGIFAQSVGGGGGSASGAGGIVSLGGKGASGGAAGSVTVTNHEGGSVATTGDGSDAIFAQSVGGGGGAGAASGGVVALGGAGASGGSGGSVTVTNEGQVSTEGERARGIFAQSVGGGGGTGGDSGGLVTIGGTGGPATYGGLVTVNNTGAISTEGNQSSAIIAQSVGGGGGDGGTTGGVFLTIGGKGSAGGDGGEVRVDHAGALFTQGDDSHGIFAQSVGGGGGNGGSTVSVSAFAGVAIGGNGSSGGAGNRVDVDLNQTSIVVGGSPTLVDPLISTEGDRSRGVFAQSVGGGGGSGGFAAQVSGGYVAAAGAAVGGKGGTGGAGGHVTVDGHATILTEGDNSEGMYVQSVGGGGGSGGAALSFAFAAGETAAASFSLALGGAGGDGGAGGLVEVDSGGSIVTEGDFSTGLVAQSVGGGGGTGGYAISFSGSGAGVGSASAAVGVGGYGGKGGVGGVVDVTFDGDIHTKGNDAAGALIQSVGGGGGNGGFNVSGAVSVAGTGAGGGSVGVGGYGGDGGLADHATGHIGGTVITEGDRSTGVIVQSVGGGGGNGGFNVSGSVGGGATAGVAVSVGVGGAGGKGGAGGEVDASAEDIETSGEQSGGFLAQSVGGGGGNGGFNVSGSIGVGGTVGGGVSVGVGGAGGDGGDSARVGAAVDGNVITHGTDSDAIVAQSVGGGGGNGAFNVSGAIGLSNTGAGAVNVGVGGSGGGGGDAGDVTLEVTGSTWTQGAGSDGIIAQSLGGGGGNGGFNVSAGVALSKTGAGTIGVSIGGMGDIGGAAGDVTLRVNEGVADPTGALLAVSTEGDGARAVVAQSVGGGGGNGGFSINAGISLAKTGSGNLGVGVGGGGGGGGDAGEVEGRITGDVFTEGDDASGVLVQSLGGGGGNGGFNVTGGISGAQTGAGNVLVGVGGFGDSGGDGGAVEGGVWGDVSTEGDNAFAVTFQSLGGGGGNGGFNVTGGIAISTSSGGGAGNLGVGVGGFGGDGGSADTVDATVIGDISTWGEAAHGVLLQSAGGGGGVGGFNVTGGISASSGLTGTVGFGMGGFGGGGGSGAAVTGVLEGDVVTRGDEAFGALLQSVGGAGGAGGINVTGAVSLTMSNSASVAVGLGVGGFGGDGGSAGSVTGTVTGNYTTSGDEADALVAQSVGGAGGAGGINISGAVAIGIGNSPTGTGAIGIGGFGGAGGNASDVNLAYAGDIETDGQNSDGFIAQSVGGGGGAGGINITGGVSITTGGGAGSVGIGLGGFGGDGGDAGDVVASVLGDVHARGSTSVEVDGETQLQNGSHGIIAQSMGGAGGVGGINITGDVSITRPGATAASRTATIGVGGFGGAGGTAGTVDLTVGSPDSTRVQVSAEGDERYAVIAQSAGGGGGVGGINISGSFAMDGTLTAGFGGFGGAGGASDDVTAYVDADLFADGDRSRGLIVQSLGGGGGIGAINISGAITSDFDTNEPAISFGIGGFGGAGATSGDVDATQIGQVMVEGADVIGVLVQSLAGGGGDGGLNVTASGTTASSTSKTSGYAIAVGVGGNGGTGADAGDVDFTSVGNVFVNATPTGSTVPGSEFLYYSPGSGDGIKVQSVGGGGGTGGINAAAALSPFGSPIVIGVGGSGGAAGNAGDVTVTRGWDPTDGSDKAGVIVTYGDESVGLKVQSVGGGGGDAGMNFTVPFTATATDPMTAVINVGGSGGASGDAGDVSVRHNGDILTNGAGSTGLFAQSIGGGGGDANLNIGLGLVRKATGVRMTVGGELFGGGTGGDVEVEHRGTIVTNGADSRGIWAESVGGGGGSTLLDLIVAPSVANTIDIGIGRHGGDGGAAGDVSVDFDGVVDTSGSKSDAIFAQSIGGGGGASSATSVGVTYTSNVNSPQEQSYSATVAVGLEGGTGNVAGDVDVTAAGTLTTRGTESRGIWAQSIGGGGGAGGSAGSTLLLDATAFGVAIGGTGGTGAISGSVSVDTDADIWTTGTEADGVLAQAIGGGGGVGGHARTIAVTGAFVPTETTTRTASIAIGGTGGTGALGGLVEVTNTGTIVTKGEKSYGVRAQSIGGGGGIGGATINARLQLARASDSFDINIGGSGGTGGAGGEVDVTNNGVIWTTGADASGISANSIGGGGGDAGLMLDAVVGAPGTGNTSHRFSINIGGSGGTGGTGGTVHVTNAPVGGDDDTGVILTEGARAYGVLAQSLGGGGGNGSSVISLTGLVAGPESSSFTLSIGGAGGTGETGGAVTVDNGGIIETKGEGAHGILAQSIGGGGGNGGLAVALAATIGSGAAATNSHLVTIGGVGGDGADGGTVVVNNSGQILTHGDNADGIVAQSIGGGGGNASMGFSLSPSAVSLLLSTPLSALIGATGGGSGGTGGTVTVNHSGDITVLGDGSTAIRAESINGGGGTLELSLEGIIGLPGVPVIGPKGVPTTKPLVSAQLGAEGATDLNAASVTVNTTGTFQAGGDNGAGAIVQSIGGGGGKATIKAVIAETIDPPTPAPLPDGVWASPLGPDEGGDSTLWATSPLASGGAASPIDFLLELGGVGGGGSGAALSTTHTGGLLTTGFNSPGVLMQSVGGGGGVGLVDLTVPAGALLGDVIVRLGGQNLTSVSTGGLVTRIQNGAIVTVGDLSPGAVLQSIGGGGGSASVVLQGAGATGAVVDVELGATGGSAQDGGRVASDFNDDIVTLGDHAVGVLAQSIGAGGGEVRLVGVDTADATLGGAGGASGDGDSVLVNVDADIYTAGAGSHGVLAQSIGGGGGAVFGAPNADVTLSADNVGDGGAVGVGVSGDVMVDGVGAYGLIAQSLGGGGGWVDGVFAGSAGGDGAGGAVGIFAQQAVLATNTDSTAVFAQSRGAGGAGDIQVNLHGMTRGGSGDGAGVRIDGGDSNTLRIYDGATLSAVSALAVDATDGDDTVQNDGVVFGDVDLGSGLNLFHNRLGSSFVAFHSIDLRDGPGSTGSFVNAGDFQMGLSAPLFPIDLLDGATFANFDGIGSPRANLLYGARVIETVELDGDYVQTADGHLAFDVAFGPYASDRVNLTGSATVDGTGDVILTWLENDDPVTLFATPTGSETDNGLEIADTLAIDFGVRTAVAGVQLVIDTDFGQDFLNANGRALGGSMDSAVEVGGASGIGRLLALLGNLRTGDEDVYASIFTEISPEPFVAALQAQSSIAQSFGDDLFTCLPVSNATLDGQCVWARAEMAESSAEATFENFGVEGSYTRFRGGFERPLNEGWSVAGSVGYEMINDLEVDDGRAHTNGKGFTAGVGLQRRLNDGNVFGGSLTGGWTWLDTTRVVDVFGPQIGTSEPETGYLQARLHGGRLMRAGDFFVRPGVEASVTALYNGGFEEDGLEGLGFKGLDDTQFVAAITPEVAFGKVFWEGEGGQEGALTVTLGARLASTDRLELPARFLGASSAAAAAIVSTPLEQETFRVETDLHLMGDDGVGVRFNYTGEFGDRTEQHQAGFNLRLRF